MRLLTVDTCIRVLTGYDFQTHDPESLPDKQSALHMLKWFLKVDYGDDINSWARATDAYLWLKAVEEDYPYIPQFGPQQWPRFDVLLNEGGADAAAREAILCMEPIELCVHVLSGRGFPEGLKPQLSKESVLFYLPRLLKIDHGDDIEAWERAADAYLSKG